jgi:hypothetical protein
VCILGLLSPLVIQAQPFGETEVAVFDTDFLAAPPGPEPEVPTEPGVPAWVAWQPATDVTDLSPPISLPESPS